MSAISNAMVVAHIDEPESTTTLLAALRRLHGAEYDFAIGRWTGETRPEPQPGRRIYRFIVKSQQARIFLRPGNALRGAPAEGPFQHEPDEWAIVTAGNWADLWPGDVICVDSASDSVMLAGAAETFDVIAEATTYPAPLVALLRHLHDRPGGCAAYPGAFRREALPPRRQPATAADHRGVNRVNEHTLDMRIDRTPAPGRHYHGVVPIGDGRAANHSEIAIVLPRSVYGLPEVAGEAHGHVVLYRRPAVDPDDREVVPVQPGSIVVTPAGVETVMGHCFENAFAMLVAIPGFVAPHRPIAAVS